jgi:hypothetical protein
LVHNTRVVPDVKAVFFGKDERIDRSRPFVRLNCKGVAALRMAQHRQESNISVTNANGIIDYPGNLSFTAIEGILKLITKAAAETLVKGG